MAPVSREGAPAVDPLTGPASTSGSRAARFDVPHFPVRPKTPLVDCAGAQVHVADLIVGTYLVEVDPPIVFDVSQQPVGVEAVVEKISGAVHQVAALRETPPRTARCCDTLSLRIR